MIRQAFDRDELRRYVVAVRDVLDAPQLQAPAARAASTIGLDGDPVAQLRGAIPSVDPELASSGGAAGEQVPFLSRDPIHSLLQSTLETKLREQGVRDETPKQRDLLSRIAHTMELLIHPVRYGPTDAAWVGEVAEAMLDQLAKGNHPFNPAPAEREIGDDARIVIVGDWGTGLPRAQAVAGFMAEEVRDALAHGREAHVVHLGDVYYSGLAEEVQRHVLAPGMWPVTVDQATAGVTSWSLNGNHDMYGGGFGYFETLLGDERFANQRSAAGQATSFFRLSSRAWDFVALDTSWDDKVLSQGGIGVLKDPQSAFVAKVAQESDRKLCLLSHHQLLSVYAPRDIGDTLTSKLGPVLNTGRVTAWIWGHEHRCMSFNAAGGVKFPRCVGHGGVPVLMPRGPGDPVPPPGAWEERGFLELEGDRWARFGFAVFDLDGDQIHVRYRDDQGSTTRQEQIG
jgi:Calcineurin-like phosphoesterase